MSPPTMRSIIRGVAGKGSAFAPHGVLPACAAMLLLVLLPGCSPSPASPANADPAAGAELMTRRACGSCHRIPGVEEATGDVGPSLQHFASRQMIAGMLPNTPANLFRYLKQPQAVVKGNVMPDEHLSDAEVGDMSAYLYTLR